MNEGITTQYFKLEKDARQGDPVSASLFIVCLEILFVKNYNFLRIITKFLKIRLLIILKY